MYDWLTEKIPLKNNVSLIDIGAYHGNFTEHLLLSQKFSKALLFEPNLSHFSLLKNKLTSHKNIYLYPFALGNYNDSYLFNCSQDDATGSLLSYHQQYHHENAGKTVTSYPVEVKKLDDFYSENHRDEPIGLIKIDTQGFDLEVLKGAEKLIQKNKPWLVIELNFLSFYKSQASITDIFNWLYMHGYCLVGFFNDHYSKDKWLAFADGIFIPQEEIGQINEPFLTRLPHEDLIRQNNYLQTVCNERLELINTIHHEAEKQQKTIEKLTQKCSKKSKRFLWF
jgi:FkbM family methyltransferase